MAKYRVPVRVGVAPVQTYERVVTVEANSRREAREIILSGRFISDLIDRPGWKPVGGRLETTRPDQTSYETYLDENGLEIWANEPAP
jgi:hypothetical protein